MGGSMPHRFPPLADPGRLPRRVVVLAPHPDDECLGCGGMLAFHAERGDDPAVVFLTDGAAGDPTGRARDLAAVRRREAAAALRELGVARITHLGFPDGRLEEAHELPGRIVGILEHEKAELVYAPSLLECHADHLAAAEAATLGVAAHPNIRVLLYGVNTAVPANELYDVSRFRAKKDAALRRYESQLSAMDLLRASRSMDAARAVNIPESAVTDCEGFCGMWGAELRDHAARFRALADWLLPRAEEKA
jgi:LmbE family N-acetylglucosaminyl deacetylase